MKPISSPTQFQANYPYANLVQLDANFAALTAAVNDSLTYSNYLLDTSAVANTINVAFATGISVALTAGLVVQFRCNNTNTGATQINVSSLGLINIVNPDGSAMSPGQLQLNGVYQVQFDGTNFQLLGSFINPAASRTVTEIAAGVTPINYAYTEGDLRRYWLATNASTQNASINNWIAVILNGAAGYLPQGTWTYTGQLTINLASVATALNGIRITGAANGASILSVVTTSSPALLITAGTTSAFYSRFESFNVLTNTNGVGVQVGTTTFVDAMNTFRFINMTCNNTNTGAAAVPLQMNYVLNAIIDFTANAAGATTLCAAQFRQVQFSWITGSHSTSAVGLYLTAGNNFGNVFAAMNYENVTFCVKSDDSSNGRNTWQGGQFVWATYGVTSTSGGFLEFLNVNPGTSLTTFVDPVNNSGVTVPEIGFGTTQFGGVIANPLTGDGVMQVNSPTGNSAHYDFYANGKLRWQWLRNNALESGSNAGSNIQLIAYADDGVTNLGNYVAITRSNATAVFRGPVGSNNVSPPAQLTGWGTPTGGSVVTNFPGATATTAQCAAVIAEMIGYFKSKGDFGA